MIDRSVYSEAECEKGPGLGPRKLWVVKTETVPGQDEGSVRKWLFSVTVLWFVI